MGRRRNSSTRRLIVAIACALGLHALLIPGLEWLVIRPIDTTENNVRSTRRSTVTVLSESEVDALLRAAKNAPRPLERKKPPEPEKPEEEKKRLTPPGQVVEIPPPAREEIPEETRYVSEYNSKVEHETRSAKNEVPTPRMKKADVIALSAGDDSDGDTRDRNKASIEKKRPKQRRKPSATPGPGMAETPSERIGDRDAVAEEVPKIIRPVPRTLDLAVGDGPFRKAQPVDERERVRRGGEGELGGATGPQDYHSLLPSMGPEEMARKDGSIDRLEDVDVGDGTFLNTREYKHAWFFNRVKRSVKEHWDPGQAYRRRDPYGRVHGIRDRVTVVEVTLTAEGDLEEIYLEKDSGVDFLDEVAIQAFRRAQPFPNPPVGLRDSSGRITFSFAFYLEHGSRGFRMFRYR